MIRYIFASLFKNSVVVEQRKKRPLWLAIIFLILGLAIYSIPQLVSNSKAKGSEIMTRSDNYELDKGLILLAQDKFDAYIDDKGVLELRTEHKKTKELFDTYTNKTPISYVVNNYKETEKSDPVTATLLNLYYYDADPFENKDTQKAFTDWINANIYKLSEDNKPTVSPKTFMILTKSCFTISVYSPVNTEKETNAKRTFTGLYNNLKNTNLNQLLVEEDGKINRTKTYDNIADFFNKSYETTKTRNLWLNFGLTTGLNFVMVMIATVVIFLFLKGKNSIYKGVSYFDSIKIAFTFVFSPAVITTIISLIIPMYQFLFIIAYIFRVMWLVSKSKVMPQQAPVYQARS